MVLTIVMSVLEIIFMIGCAILLAIEYMKENRVEEEVIEEFREDDNVTYLHDVK